MAPYLAFRGLPPRLGGLLLAAGGARACEEPAYEILYRGGEYEVRWHSSYIVAETTVAGGFDETGDAAFRRLAGYVFGDNRRAGPGDGNGGGSVRMGMTAPVTRHRGGPDGERTVYRFVMERGYDMDSLPVPNDDRVELRIVPGGPVAVLRYRGRIAALRFDERAGRLLDALRRAGFEPAGEGVSAVYDGPLTPPFLRRNEVLVPLPAYPR